MKNNVIMVNPWENIISKSIGDQTFYYAAVDENDLFDEQGQLRERWKNDYDYALHLEMYPEPFQGYKEPDILLLNGNAGYTDDNKANKKSVNGKTVLSDNQFIGNKKFNDLLSKCYADKDGFFIYTNKNEKLKDIVEDVGGDGAIHPGTEWWEKRAGTLLSKKKVLCIEYFPYHSKKFTYQTEFPSNKYSDNLIKSAMENKIPIIILRNKKEWYERIKGLREYEKLYITINTQNVSITCDNLARPIPSSEWDDLC